MSVRVGIGLTGWPFAEQRPDLLYRYAERCEELGFDSLWLTERLAGPQFFLEPMTAIAALAARTRSLKFGMAVAVLPARNPVVLARQVATIDFLSGGRMLPAFGLGTDDAREQEATGVPRSERAGRTDEATDLMRRLWTEDHVSHQGRYFHLTDVTISPKPILAHQAVWFGGRSEAAFRRVGRHGNGWLASAVTPEEAREAIPAINRYAAAAGRALDPDHFGMILGYNVTDDRDAVLARYASALIRQRSEVAPTRLAAVGTADQCAELLEEYVDAGVSKFVLRAACAPDELFDQLERLADGVLRRVEAKAVPV